MTTAADLVQEVRDLVYSGTQDEFNMLAAPYTPGSGVLSFKFDLRGITPGSVLSVGLSDFYVWTVNSLAKTVEVQSGHQGSEDLPQAQNSLARVRPRFTDRVIFGALNRDIRAMSSPSEGLYREGSWNPPVDVVDQAFAVPAEHIGMFRLLAVRVTPVAEPDRWLEVNGRLLTSDGEKRVVLDDSLSPSDTVEITYAAPFTEFASLADDYSVSGLTEHLRSIPVYGAGAVLAMGEESRRNLLAGQSETRRPDEVPPGAMTGVAREYARARRALADAEAARLQRRYPYRRTIPRPSE